MAAPRPAARAPHAFFELFAGAPDPALARLCFLGVLDPADELVACQRGDVVPRLQRPRAGDQRAAQVRGEIVDDAARDRLAGHSPMVARKLDYDAPMAPASARGEHRPSTLIQTQPS